MESRGHVDLHRWYLSWARETRPARAFPAVQLAFRYRIQPRKPPFPSAVRHRRAQYVGYGRHAVFGPPSLSDVSPIISARCETAPPGDPVASALQSSPSPANLDDGRVDVSQTVLAMRGNRARDGRRWTGDDRG